MQRRSPQQRIEAELGAEVRAQEPMEKWTTLRVGGPAALWVRPRTPDALAGVLRLARDEGMPVTLIGGGANTLVGDGGIEGLTLKLPADLLPEESIREGGQARLTLCGGAAISRLIQRMKVHGVVGAEFLAGIPGTLGGAVAMNAGTKMGECMSVVEAVELATPDGIGWVPRTALTYEYRHTHLPLGAVVTRVRFALPEGDLAESSAKMDADLSYRKRTQPLSLPNCGSVFRNPPNENAGRLIERVKLKGHTIGRAQISSLHANWIVNLGGALASDVVALMELCQRRVHEEMGLQLVPEVKRVGSFGP